MTKPPLSPREKITRAVIIVGWVILCGIFTWIALKGPTQEQMVDTPSGEYQR